MASTTRTASSVPRPAPTDPREDLSTAASVLTSFSNSSSTTAAPPPPPIQVPVAYTPTTHRVSKAKKGKKVHACEFGCGKVFSRAEHRRRHEANHRSEPLYRCPEPGCEKTFQRPDLLNRHLERQHNYGPGNHAIHRPEPAPPADMRPHINPVVDHLRYPQSPQSPTMNDFDVYGEEIRELLLKQKWPLKDIKAYMEDKHSFGPLDDHVYEQAFSRLCLQPPISPLVGQLPVPGQAEPEHRPELDPMLVAQSSLHLQHPPAARTSEDSEALQRLGRSIAANTRDLPSGENTSTANSRRPSETRHDCPAPGCVHHGDEGFDTKEQLWAHITARHTVS